MAAPSELGPIDPQIIRRETSGYRRYSAYGLVTSYEKLFVNAVRSKGNLEPFMQQLAKFDIRDIHHYRDVIKLSEDIAIKILKSGMMKAKSKPAIKRSIGVFLDPGQGTISHGRSIHRDEAKACGLKIHDLDVHSAEWVPIYELYTRTAIFVASQVAAKCVESSDEVFYVPPPSGL